MKWAIIGSTSFSGRSFARYLENRGETVGRFGRPAFDLNLSLEAMCDAIEMWKPDYVVNFAAQSMVAESWSRPEDWYQTNVVALSRLTERLRKFHGMQKYVHISTPEVYGHTKVRLVESHDYYPTTPYAVSRAAADMHLMVLHKAYDFPVCFTRSVNVYGAGQQLFRIVPKTIMCILGGEKLKLEGGGTSERSFIHIDDVSASVVLVATKGRPGQIYHTSTRKMTTIRELVLTICHLMDKDPRDVIEDVPERLGKDMAYWLDSSKIRDELGWTDRIPLNFGLIGTIAWIKANYKELKLLPQKYVHRS